MYEQLYIFDLKEWLHKLKNRKQYNWYRIVLYSLYVMNKIMTESIKMVALAITDAKN